MTRFAPEIECDLVDLHDLHTMTKESDKPIKHVNANIEFRKTGITTGKLNELTHYSDFANYIALVRPIAQ